MFQDREGWGMRTPFKTPLKLSGRTHILSASVASKDVARDLLLEKFCP